MTVSIRPHILNREPKCANARPRHRPEDMELLTSHQEYLIEQVIHLKMKLAEVLFSLDQVLLERGILSDENQRLGLEVRNSFDRINAGAHPHTSIFE